MAQSGYDLESLMRTYGNEVLRTAYLYVKDIHAAEDIFQDVFLKVNMKLDTFREESSIKTWLIRITINVCKDYLKSAYQRKIVTMEEFMEDSITAQDDYEQIERKETCETVKEAVMQLPEHYRAVILCVYYQEMSMEEAAKVLDLPVGTVKSRLARAKSQLKETVEGRLELGKA